MYNLSNIYLTKTRSIYFFILMTLFIRCSNDIDQENTQSINNLDSDDIAVNLEGELQISDFVWKGLNEFYYWQEEVEALSDEKLNNEKTYASFISENSNPEIFFNSLKHPEDRFSWIEKNYIDLENTLQGIFATNGVEFGLLYACENCNELIGFVKYILKDSDADGKNIQRGDFFTGVNGIRLTSNNYRSLLFGENLSYTLNMSSLQSGTLISNGINVELTKEENFKTNPIQISKTLSIPNGEKVGYLMYNQFVADISDDLNKTFAYFKTEGVTELILDLRYNGGGSVQNCVELASMITGQFNSEIFAQEIWNQKLLTYLEERFGKESLINRFVNKLENEDLLNSLKFDRVYVITSSESASASELLINGLTPYIEVIQVGEKTFGKNVGSITVYDYIDNEKTKNPDHTYAMQPIVLKIANSDGYADYTDGLEPSTEVEEDIRNLGILGDPFEPLLATTLNLISGTGKFKTPKAELTKKFLVKDPLMLKKQKMFVEKKLLFYNR